MFNDFFSGKLEADDAPLCLVYHHFGQLYNHFTDNSIIQAKVKHRWDFMSTESTGISYMLTPKFAADGFYVDDDRLDIIHHVNLFVSSRYPGLGEKAEQEMAQFLSKMTCLQGVQKETIFKLDSKCYWNIIGRHDYPTLYLCARIINEMICSSAASERVWSIFRFIHSRLRNRLSNDKVEKLAFIYINCAILDKHDQTDYLLNVGTALSGTDCQQENPQND